MKTATTYKTNLLSYMVIFGVVIYVAIDVLLAHLRPSYSLLHNAESDYGRGPYAWVMDINFLLRCFFSLVLVKALWITFTKNTNIKKSSYWLVVWAIASGLLAFFADNPYGYSHLWSGPIHLLLAFVAFISALIAMVLLSRQFRLIQTWYKTATSLLVISLLAIISILLLGHAGFRPNSLGGLYERLFLGLVLVWEVIVAAKIISTKNAN